MNLNSGKIFYAKKDGNGVITDLILNNVTGDMCTYAVIKNVDKAVKGTNATYTYIVDGNTASFSSSSVYSVTGGTPVRLTFSANGAVYSMAALTKIGEKISLVDSTSVRTASEVYPLSDKVVVYAKDYNYNYSIIPISDIYDNDEYTLNAYADKTASAGGRVRVIIATKK